MGIGFDMFKASMGARIGDAIADGFINAFIAKPENTRLDSVESENTETWRITNYLNFQEKNIEQENILRIFVFMLAKNVNLGRELKKYIAGLLSDLYHKKISLFSIEEQLDSLCLECNENSPIVFFEPIEDIRYDSDFTIGIYLIVLNIFAMLITEEKLMPAHIYNLYLIRKYFLMDRSKLNECYTLLSEAFQQDVDDVADMFEQFSNEDAIESLKENDPSLNYEDIDVIESCTQQKTIAVVEVVEDYMEQIQDIYYQIGNNAKYADDFYKRVCLADKRPDMIDRAVQTYARNCIGENAILIFDDTLSLNCKSGFLLTNKAIYVGLSGKLVKYIPLADVTFLDAKIGFLTNELIINDTKIQTEQISGGTVALCDLLEKIIPLAMKVKCE